MCVCVCLEMFTRYQYILYSTPAHTRAECALHLATETLTCFRALFYLWPAPPQITRRTCAPNGRLIICVIAFGSGARDKHCARTRFPFLPAAVVCVCVSVCTPPRPCGIIIIVCSGHACCAHDGGRLEIIVPTQFPLCIHRQTHIVDALACVRAPALAGCSVRWTCAATLDINCEWVSHFKRLHANQWCS